VATQFATLLTFFTVPISTVLFPAFSKIDPQKERELLRTVFASSVKYTAIILVPATMAVMTLSKPMISTLFGEKWTYAPSFLTLYVVNNLFVIFGSLPMGSILAGLGETKIQMILSVITLAFGIPLSLLFIPSMGIMGLIITSVTAGIPSMGLGLYLIWRRYKTKADMISSMKIMAAALAAAAITFLVTNLTSLADWMELTAGGIIFLATYLVIAPVAGAISQTDIRNLKTMFSGLGIISKMLNITLTTMERLSKAS
jgi:O-antigen/teichoic acid export membrane protein